MFFKNNDIATFKLYCEVAFTYENGNNFPGLLKLEQEEMLPLLGSTLFATLQAQAQASSIAPQYEEVMHLVRGYVAPACVLKTLALRSYKITDSGAKKTSSDGTDNLFRWEYEEVKESLADAACEAYEKLVAYLIAHATALGWTNPQTDCIFNSALELADCIALHQPYRVFRLMLPIIKIVEKTFIYQTVGDDFYKALIAKANPDADEKAVLDLLRLAVGNLSVYKATLQLPVKITPWGLTVMYHPPKDKTNNADQSAPDARLSTLANTSLSDGKQFLRAAIKMLNQKATDSLFPEFKNSVFYVGTTVVAKPANDKKVFRF